MSQENVEIVRQAYAALSRGDVDTLREMAWPEFVFDFSRRLVDPVVQRGLDESLAYFSSQAREEWEDWPAWEPQELIDADDQVVAHIRTSARGKGSAVEVEAYVWNLWKFRDGKLVELTYFGDDQAAALKPAGLSEYHAEVLSGDTGPMPSEHADLVRRCLGCWVNRDIEALLECIADDAVLDLSRNIFNREIYRGHDGVRRWFATVDEIWTDFELGAIEIIGEADDRVVTATQMAGIGRVSGVPAEMEVCQVWTLRDGKVARLVGGYRSRDDALEAAGLPE